MRSPQDTDLPLDVFRGSPDEYPDWEQFNPPQTWPSAGSAKEKQAGRFRFDILDCQGCGEVVSEHEAFYLFARQPFWKRLLGRGSLYVCPKCGGRQLTCALPAIY